MKIDIKRPMESRNTKSKGKDEWRGLKAATTKICKLTQREEGHILPKNIYP